jgi:exonuclease SbcC
MAADRFHQRLEGLGFADQNAFARARRTEEVMDHLEGQVRRYHGEVRAASERLDRAKRLALGLEKPDLKALVERVSEFKAALEAEVKKRGVLQEQQRQLEAWDEALERIERDREDQEARYGAVGRIAEVANGRNPQKITFQRFVLAALLDDVLAAASVRLRMMSRERYDLQRAREQVDMRLPGGLELMVFDAFTGKLRPVSTLSGGESFLASLALALGLADVVQAYAGGLRLETIFVDEGFGSLDPESLDLAYQSLVRILGGGRLVGVISHVPELKERIDARLEIRPGRQGSEAAFVL